MPKLYTQTQMNRERKKKRTAMSIAKRAERGYEQARRDLADESFRCEQIRREARSWKDLYLASRKEGDELHASMTSAQMRAHIAERDRDLIERKLDSALEQINDQAKATAIEVALRVEAQNELQRAQGQSLATINRIAQMLPEQPADDAFLAPDIQVRLCFDTDGAEVVELTSYPSGQPIRVMLNGDTVYDESASTISLEEHKQTLQRHAGAHRTQLLQEEARADAALENSRKLADELEQTRKELASTSESLRISEDHFEAATLLAEQRQTDHENATHIAELHRTAFKEMKRLVEQRQAKIDELQDSYDCAQRHFNEAISQRDEAADKLGAGKEAAQDIVDSTAAELTDAALMVRDRDEQIDGLRTKNDKLKLQAGDFAHQLAQVQDVARTAVTHRDEAVRDLKRARHELAESRAAHAAELSTQDAVNQRHLARLADHITTRDTALAAADKLVKVLLDESVNIIAEELEAYADATAEVEPAGTKEEHQRLLEKDRTITTETINLVKSITKMPWFVGPDLKTLRKELNI